MNGVHPFELAGLGRGPFSLEDVFDAGCVNAECDYCSTAIRYQFWCLSHDGKRFKVGVDCIRKIAHADNRLASAAELEMAKLTQAQREEKRRLRAKMAERRREIALAAERERNGGLTDAEVRQAAERAATVAREQQFATDNAWLLAVLDRAHQSDFVLAMQQRLHQSLAIDLSPRMQSCLRDIYAEHESRSRRRGSKAYLDAADRFDDLLASQMTKRGVHGGPPVP